jgi:hypothetical protein
MEVIKLRAEDLDDRGGTNFNTSRYNSSLYKLY